MAKPATSKNPIIGKDDDLARAIEQLSPDEAAFFLSRLEAVIRKRKIQLTGYLTALGVWALGMFLALLYYGTHDGFIGWVFLVPFALVGIILYMFGRWSTAVGNAGKDTGSEATQTKPQV
ncbi:MAG: hypothetical protein AB7O24_11515 [Kofleriaceae bacterium]